MKILFKFWTYSHVKDTEIDNGSFKKILLIARIRFIMSDMNNWNFIEICSKEAETIPYQSKSWQNRNKRDFGELRKKWSTGI